MNRKAIIPLIYLGVCFVNGHGDSTVLRSIPFFTKPAKRSRRALMGSNEYIVQYEGFGIHFIKLLVGNPSQLLDLAVDTGSDFTAFPCEDCKINCGNRGPRLFNYSLSDTFSGVACGSCSAGLTCQNSKCNGEVILLDYSTWQGYEVSDKAYHGSNVVDPTTQIGSDAAKQFGFDIKFICQTKTRGYFDKVRDGVMGFSAAPSSFVNQMHAATMIPRPRFSLCFNDRNLLEGGGVNTGVVTFGGFDREFLETEMVYAKKLAGNSYRVNLVGIQLRTGGGNSIWPRGNQPLVTVELPEGADHVAEVNSGVPFLTLNSAFRTPFETAWKQVTGTDFSYRKQSYTTVELEALPTLILEIEGDSSNPPELDPRSLPNLSDDSNVLVAVPAVHYMERLPVQVNTNPYRPRIQFDDGISFLGANMMQGHTISYELDTNQIGFAESKQCAADRANQGRTSGSSGVTSVGTSGSTGRTTNGATTISAAGDDDLFVVTAASAEAPANPAEDLTGGGCFSSTCRSFMAIGYVFIGTALAVAYRLSRPKDRDNKASGGFRDDTQVLYSQDDISPAYRRKAWNEEGTLV